MDELDFLEKKYRMTVESVKGRFKSGSIFYSNFPHSYKLTKADMDHLVPSFLLEPSHYREHGFMVWDMIMKTLSKLDLNQEEPAVRPIKPESDWNSQWIDKDFSSGRQAYSYFTKDRITLPWHIDLSKEIGGFEWYKAIHCLSHQWADPIVSMMPKKYWPYVYPRYIPMAAANAAVSILYDKGIYLGEPAFKKNWSIPITNGLKIYASIAVNNNRFLIPLDELSSINNVDKLFGCVFVYVFIQSPPTTFEDPLDIHKFAGGPSRMLVAGWESIDFLINCPIVFVGKRKYVSVDVVDLLPPDTLRHYYRQRHVMGMGNEGTKFLPWAGLEARNIEYHTPTIPDRQCSIFLPEFEDRPVLSKDPVGKEKYRRRRRDIFDKIKSMVIEYEQSIRATKDEKKALRSDRARCNKGYKDKLKQLKLRKLGL